MIYWKEECRVLATERAEIVVVDSYDERGVPVFAVRQVTKAVGTRSGRNLMNRCPTGVRLWDFLLY